MSRTCVTTKKQLKLCASYAEQITVYLTKKSIQTTNEAEAEKVYRVVYPWLYVSHLPHHFNSVI